MKTAAASTGNPWRNLSSLAFIFTGLAIMVLVWFKARADYQEYHSPFDQIDQAAENQQGFLPMLLAVPSTAGELEGEDSLELDLHQDGQTAPILMAPALEGITDPQAPPANVQANPGLAPQRLLIPVIGMNVAIEPADSSIIQFEGKRYLQWQAPNGNAPGWQTDSAGLGVPGNTVMYGHHNVGGKVFENLHKLEVGQRLQLKSGDELFTYRIVLTMILEERNQPLEVRLDNAKWLMPSSDERVTLVTCWPATGNSHRVIVVAVREITATAAEVAAATPAVASGDEPAPPPVVLAPPLEETAADPNLAPPDLEANPGLAPERLLIPIIGLYAPVVPAERDVLDAEGVFHPGWGPPRSVAAGWQPDSAGLGVRGNTVLYGYHNVYGSVFASLHTLVRGQVIQLKSGEELFSYQVVKSEIIEGNCPAVDPLADSTRWLFPAQDERITLTTCWPFNANTHRVIVVAIRFEP